MGLGVFVTSRPRIRRATLVLSPKFRCAGRGSASYAILSGVVPILPRHVVERRMSLGYEAPHKRMNEPYRRRPKTIQVKKAPHMKMRSKYMERLKGILRKLPNKK